MERANRVRWISIVPEEIDNEVAWLPDLPEGRLEARRGDEWTFEVLPGVRPLPWLPEYPDARQERKGDDWLAQVLPGTRPLPWLPEFLDTTPPPAPRAGEWLALAPEEIDNEVPWLPIYPDEVPVPPPRGDEWTSIVPEEIDNEIAWLPTYPDGRREPPSRGDEWVALLLPRTLPLPWLPEFPDARHEAGPGDDYLAQVLARTLPLPWLPEFPDTRHEAGPGDDYLAQVLARTLPLPWLPDYQDSFVPPPPRGDEWLSIVPEEIDNEVAWLPAYPDSFVPPPPRGDEWLSIVPEEIDNEVAWLPAYPDSFVPPPPRGDEWLSIVPEEIDNEIAWLPTYPDSALREPLQLVAEQFVFEPSPRPAFGRGGDWWEYYEIDRDRYNRWREADVAELFEEAKKKSKDLSEQEMADAVRGGLVPEVLPPGFRKSSRDRPTLQKNLFISVAADLPDRSKAALYRLLAALEKSNIDIEGCDAFRSEKSLVVPIFAPVVDLTFAAEHRARVLVLAQQQGFRIVAANQHKAILHHPEPSVGVAFIAGASLGLGLSLIFRKK